MRRLSIALGSAVVVSTSVFAVASCSSNSTHAVPISFDGSTSNDAAMDTSALPTGDSTTTGNQDSGLQGMTDGGPLPVGPGTFGVPALTNFVPDGGATGAYGLVAADFNKDNKIDLAAGGSSGVYVFLGNGDGSFAPPTQVPAGTKTTALTVIDANSDGSPDLAIGDDTGNLSILIGNGDGTFLPVVTYDVAVDGGTYVNGIGSGDVNGDTHPDLVTSNNTGLDVFLNAGDAAMAPPAHVTVTNDPFDVVITDVNGDQKQDLVLGSAGPNVFVLLGQGNGNFGTPSPYLASQSDFPYGVAVADFNGDKLADIATANFYGNDIGILAGQAGGGFHTPPALSDVSLGSIYGIAVGDFNRDGKPDIAVNSEATAHVAVLLNQGTTFGPATIYAQPVVGDTLITADFNGDQKLDLAVFCHSAVSILLGN